MAKRMLIDATHPDETRVVVLSGKSVEEFDYETASKAQIKGNIYLAKVTRVEPSLQAAFIEYGGNRHGFLPFSEIHPDYYRIPIADREALIAEEAQLRGEAIEEAAEAEATAGDGEEEAESERPARRSRSRRSSKEAADEDGSDEEPKGGVEEIAQETKVDTVGGEEVEDSARRRAQLLRRYKIQEVIKRRQVMLVQVTKEERGNKGAALTTYLSLAGRYCVLMPNTAKGGGISRKIANAADRRRLKSVVGEMAIPEGMAVIVRTAGSERTKAEIKRDYEYLIRLWDDIRGKTLQSTAPCLIHEEASLIKRAIRDLYDRDMEEVLVEGAEGYKHAKDFMKMLMPSHARKVKPYVEASMPLFHRYQVEGQLDAMYSPQVQLRSGGSIVLNPTEALVAIDVNSGRSTRERHIEETALKTNIEAAEEVARQLRLRDLAGLIVIDFIDMEEPRHNREVERRLKEAMKSDRARIQLGRISPFGLLELSRQRLRPSLFETAMMQCQRCNATGYVRAPDAGALVVLRALTEEGVRKGGGEVEVRVPLEVALNMLNEKRAHIVELEQRFGLRVAVRVGEHMGPADFEVVRHSTEASPVQARREPLVEEDEDVEALVEAGDGDEEQEDASRRRPRRRRGGRRERDDGRAAVAEPQERRADSEEEEEEFEVAAADGEAGPGDRPGAEEESEEERKGKRRRRGRRGGRRRSRRRPEEETTEVRADEGDDRVEEQPLPAAEAEPALTTEEPGDSVEVAAEAETPPPAVVESAATEAEPKKPARRSRARKAPKAETTAGEAAGTEAAAQTVEAAADQGATPEATPEAEAKAAPAKPTRRRRKPTAKAIAEAETPAEAPSAEPATVAPAEEPVRARRPHKAEPPSNGAGQPPEKQAIEEQVTEAQRAEEPAAEENRGEESRVEDSADREPSAAHMPPGSDEQESDRPRRKGWWNRLMS